MFYMEIIRKPIIVIEFDAAGQDPLRPGPSYFILCIQDRAMISNLIDLLRSDIYDSNEMYHGTRQLNLNTFHIKIHKSLQQLHFSLHQRLLIRSLASATAFSEASIRARLAVSAEPPSHISDES